MPLNPDTLKYSWTAIVELNNGKVITIWHTAWPSIKSIVKNIVCVSSDYPKNILCKQN
jgi:hypothetical protein